MKATAEEWRALGVEMPDIVVRIANGGEIPIQAILLREPTKDEIRLARERLVKEWAEDAPRLAGRGGTLFHSQVPRGTKEG